MVTFKEGLTERSDHLFVKEDPVRIYRGLKDFLVDEFGVDRIEEGHMEFNMSKPKDRIRMHAYKEKSPYTVIHWELSFKAKEPRDIYKYDRDDDILKARIAVDPEVITVYPGADPISWMPHGTSDTPDSRFGFNHLRPEERTRFERSKLYRILVGIWYHKFYSKEIHKYKEEADEVAVRIHNLMRERFGVEKTIARTGSSHYKPPWSG